MVNDQERIPCLGEAAVQYLAKLSSKEKDSNQPEIYQFARWCGWDKSFKALAGPAVENYAEHLSVSDTDYTRKLALVRAFLAYAKKAGWSQINLGIHLKTKKNKNSPIVKAPPRKVNNGPEPITLTQGKYDELTKELEILKGKSQKLMHDIQTAAADKDFRENAPLHAAREERGHVEGRIKELKQTLNAATIIDENKALGVRSVVGDSIVICDPASGEECRYTIVDPREVNPSKGKISIASPIGKALHGKQAGQEVEITAPAGKLRYRIVRIER
jgi:transcription elongation factor GreA